MRLFIVVFVGVFALQTSGNQGNLRNRESPELIPWWSVNIGGTIQSGNGSYRLSSSVGQSVAGRTEDINYVVQAGFWNAGIILIGIDESLMQQVPRVHSISQNYPNPFHRYTTIRYAIPESEPVRIEVFNIAGQSVKVLVDEVQTPGYKVTTWNGREEGGANLVSGVYFYRIITPDFHTTRKMLLLR